ncbi:MAG: MraY family glycosyltransferase [Thermodesulfobacteriota bacterium]|nr:MraY family glycosyltransferase [Thermodesulfobacteriota bacterium]
MVYLSTLLFSMFITLSLIPLFTKLAVRVHAMDVPNHRKVHPYPVPKSGGLAMALGAVVPVLLTAHGDPFLTAVVVGAGIVVLFGLIDDFRSLGYKAKFTGQIAGALVVVFYGGVKITSLGMLLPEGAVLPDWVAVPFTLLVIVGVSNAINLADGLDGLAGGICLLSFICIGYLAYMGEHVSIALLSVAMAGAIFAFLRYNTHPATLFMGDAGSQLMGFLAVTLCLGLTQDQGPLSPVLPLILLGFPVLDTLTVMLERVAEGRSPFVADKNHFHHKLMRLGLYHTEAVFVVYVIQTLLVTSAFVFRFYSEWFLLMVYVLFSVAILAAFFYADKTGWKLARYDLLDVVIKGKLRVLKEKRILIRVSFKMVEIGLPVMLLFCCLLPANVPRNVGLLAWSFFGLTAAVLLVKRKWAGGMYRLSAYLLVPFLIYLAERYTVTWMSAQATMAYNLSFVALVLFVVLTLKYTSRKKGFKTTPMDFLILVIVVIVPNLPDPQIRAYGMGLVAAKIVVIFFTYEVLMGELRGELKHLGWTTMAVLGITGLRGFIG